MPATYPRSVCVRYEAFQGLGRDPYVTPSAENEIYNSSQGSVSLSKTVLETRAMNGAVHDTWCTVDDETKAGVLAQNDELGFLQQPPISGQDDACVLSASSIGSI